MPSGVAARSDKCRIELRSGLSAPLGGAVYPEVGKFQRHHQRLHHLLVEIRAYRLLQEGGLLKTGMAMETCGAPRT